MLESMSGSTDGHSPSNGNAIAVRDLHKRFGEVHAVRGVAFEVAPGEVFGFLGPNGAGKTTTINMLCTLTRPTSGRATVGGHDVVRERDDVRRNIGLVFQESTLDGYLTAEQNLRMHAELYGVPSKLVAGRLRQVLEMVELWDRRSVPVLTFSGGMRRRLEIARGLMHSPRVLFLDEPTIGLDPQTRASIWAYIRELQRSERITIFLTTHYMDEAEVCDRIAIIDHGEIVAQGSPARLKAMAAVERQVVIHLAEPPEIGLKAVEIRLQASPAIHHARHVIAGTGIPMFFLRCADTSAALNEALAVLHAAAAPVTTIQVREPSLEDAFLAATGREYEEAPV
jgi:ABC-2 type transport system ATP-binding protein